MTHWRVYTEVDTLREFHLQGKDTTVTIDRVEGGEIVTMEGKKPGKKKLPMCFFVGKKLPLGLNTTNANTITALYGPHVEDWRGKKVTLYPTTTSVGGETKPCIRIRNTVPNASE